jgi:Transposase DDE domain group 1
MRPRVAAAKGARWRGCGAVKQAGLVTLRPQRDVRAAALHTAAYRLLHTLRSVAPKQSYWRQAQFDTLRLALIRVAARGTELATRIKLSLPSGYPYRDSLTLLATRAARPP